MNKIKLTDREYEILTLIVDGQNNNEISQKLSISNSTVKAICKSIFLKLEVDNRVRAAVKALMMGIVYSKKIKYLTCSEYKI